MTSSFSKTHAEVIFREIAYGSDAYRCARDLRQEVLRRPLGLSLDDEDLGSEASQMHFGLFQGGVLLACIIAAPASPREVKLRQMAVSPSMQGRGYGRRLVVMLEAELVSRGYVTSWLHARASAVEFYVRLGFQCTGSEFLEVGIPHLKMCKRLTRIEGVER